MIDPSCLPRAATGVWLILKIYCIPHTVWPSN